MFFRRTIWFILTLFIFFNGANLSHEYKHIADLDSQIHEHEHDSHHSNKCDDCNVFKQLSNIYAYENYELNQKVSSIDLSIYLRNLNSLSTKNLFIRGPPTNS